MYQEAFAQYTEFSDPPLAKEIQEIIDAVNTDSTPPVFSSSNVASVDENSGANQIIYTAQATDDNPPIRYSLNPNIAETFWIDSKSGELRLIPNPDYENQSQYQIDITAADLANNQALLRLTLTINDLDEVLPNNPTQGSVSIDGISTEGQTLTANTGGLTDPDGIGTFTYQWKAGGTDIAGATSSSYTLTQAEVGKIITVEVTHTDALGTQEPAISSSPTTAVGNVNDPLREP